MSIRLIVEVLDHYHGKPTHKLWLLAFAEVANDQTRAGWAPRYKLAHRTGVSASRASHIAAALIAEGVVKRGGNAYHGHAARYVLVPLPVTERVRPDSNLKVAAPQQPSAEQDSKLKVAAPRRKVAAPQQPIPHIPSVDPFTAAAPPPPTTAQTILAEFIDWDRANDGTLTGRTIGQLAKQIGELLAEGIAEAPIERGLADWRVRKQHPSTLHSFVDAAMTAPPSGPGARTSGGRWARQIERARLLDAADAAGRGELT